MTRFLLATASGTDRLPANKVSKISTWLFLYHSMIGGIPARHWRAVVNYVWHSHQTPFTYNVCDCPMILVGVYKFMVQKLNRRKGRRGGKRGMGRGGMEGEARVESGEKGKEGLAGEM